MFPKDKATKLESYKGPKINARFRKGNPSEERVIRTAHDLLVTKETLRSLVDEFPLSCDCPGMSWLTEIHLEVPV